MTILNKSDFKHICFTVAAGFLLCANNAHAARSAVAVSVSTGRGTISSCKANAPADALAGCRAQHLKDCRVAAVVTNGYVAIAGVKGSPQTYRAAGAATARAAAKLAVNKCGLRKCVLISASNPCYTAPAESWPSQPADDQPSGPRYPEYHPCGNQYCSSGGGVPLNPGQLMPDGRVVPGIQD